MERWSSLASVWQGFEDGLFFGAEGLRTLSRLFLHPRAMVFRKSPAPRRLQVSTAASGGCLRWKLNSHLPPSYDGER